MPTYRDRGFVLRSRTIRDADRHYVFFTEGHGKIVILAKGSRKGKSKLSPHLSSFGIVDLMVAKGRYIDRLAGASLSRPFRNIPDSLEGTAVAQSFLLAVDSLTRRDMPEERIFCLVSDLLAALDHGARGCDEMLLFDTAISKLMGIIGFELELDVCVKCRKAFGVDAYTMHLLRGGVECRGCSDGSAIRLSPGTVPTLRLMRQETLTKMSTFSVGVRERREIGEITDALLVSHIESRFSALRYMRSVVPEMRQRSHAGHSGS